MNKDEAEIVIKDTIEYANKEIEKNKKKTRGWIIGLIFISSILLIAGIILFNQKTPTSADTTPTTTDGIVLVPYSQNPDGSWTCGGRIYQYRLEITGRMSNAATDSTFIYLSNRMDITFDQAWKAAGLSSNMNDYFDEEDAILVEFK